MQAPWTYELPVTASFAENLDDYEVRTADGAHAGIATGLVERDGERYLLVDAGRLLPLLHRRLAVPWSAVAAVDHDALVVELALDGVALEATALALDPGLARHDASAEAVRVHDLPAELVSPVVPGTEGPVEGTGAFAVVVLAALTPFSLFAIVAVWIARGLGGWELAVLAVPLLLGLLTLAAGEYWLYREPHAGRRASRPRGPAAPA